MLATQFMQEARVLFDQAKKASTSAMPASVGPAGTAPKSAGPVPASPVTAMSPLSFKATLLDENSNLILEGGERIRVRVDVVNTGPQAVQDIVVHLGGPPTLITQFPATTLSTGALEAGGSNPLNSSPLSPHH